ncbi:AraC family transcriptional regulator [Cnuella takakiae]|nr:AraC family transcriptional regulator [Cnuella takakiae]OLY94720.1 AraC family transcriptional regulator [Cnuella takakiae]
MKNQFLHEITPLTQSDCYTVFTRSKTGFDFPLHYHEEFELNAIFHGKGAQRVVGDHIGEIGDMELVLVGPNLKHAWFNHHLAKGAQIQEVTIQFHRDLLDEKMLRRNQLSFIRKMFEQSLRGILFSPETTEALAPRLLNLNQKHGFDGVLELLSILHDLSISRNMKLLADSPMSNEIFSHNSRRVQKAMEYMNHNFDKPVSLGEVARLASMTEVGFSRFFKSRTGNNFIDTLNDIRLGHASRMLIETTQTISEIAYHCGFNNIANFNRIFKKKKNCTPKEFRESYQRTAGTRVFI